MNDIDITQLIQGEEGEQTKIAQEQQVEQIKKKPSSFYCDAMDDLFINNVVEEVYPEVAFLIGFPDYGRSTFIGSVYHTLLTEGGIDGYHFVDSNTFSGFERRLYLRNAKNTKYNIIPTKRTVRGEKYFVDFILENDEKVKVHIVLADRAGEDYKSFCDTGFPEEGFESIRYASRFVFFLDAVLLTELSSDDVVDKVCQLITRMGQNGIFHDGLTIDVVLNKIEMVGDENKQMLDDNINVIVEKVKTVSKVNDIKSHKISSLFNVDDTPLKNYLAYLVRSSIEKRTKNVEQSNCLDWVKQKIEGGTYE